MQLISVFPKCFSLNSANSVTKKIMTLKGLEPLPRDQATSCIRDQHGTTAPVRHVRDWIFKLSPIHASVIYQFL